MDTKYFINRDENGKIRWIGIDSANGFITKKINDRDNKALYDYHLHAVNAETNGEFFNALDNSQIANMSESFFTIAANQNMQSEPRLVATKVQEAPQEIVEKEEKTHKKASKALIALAIAAGLLLLSATAYAGSDKLQAAAGKLFGKNKTQTENFEDVDEEASLSELEGKSVSELIEMLNDEEQEEAFERIVNTQDYFNEEAAPTVSQKDKQLYFTFDETTSAYMYANAKALGSDKLASFFGKSKIMLLNEDTDEYEEMNKDLVSAKYLSFCNILSYYYQLGATTRSGVDGLFENEKEGEFFREFEDLILAYNKNHSEETKAAIRAKLEEIYMSGNVDSLSDKYQGASSFIGTAIVPYLYLNRIIDKDTYKAIVEINETITCQDIYTQIGKILNCETAENGKELIIERIAYLQNLKTKDLDRNLSMEESLEGYRLSDLGQFVLGATPGFSSSKTITKHYQKITKDRKEAVKATSESAVKKAEEEADKKAGIDEKNADEDAYWDGYMDGYNKAYDNVWGGGSGNVSVPSGSARYVQGFKDGVASGKAAAREDKEKAQQDQDNYKPETHEEVIDETFVPENGENNNNSNSDSNNDSNSNATSNTESYSAPREEVVEETFVYESDNNVSCVSNPKVRVRA